MQMDGREKNTEREALTMLIFGGTGDLTHRKLLPALYHLMSEGRLPQDSRIVAIGRRPKGDAGYREEARASVHAHSRTKVEEADLGRFLDRLHYYQMEFIREPGSFQGLKDFLKRIEGEGAGSPLRLFFLAVAPEHFGPVVTRLHQHGLAEHGNLRHRVMIEKPFGSDLDSARALNHSISQALEERQVYRIDHYLGKEMIRNILAIRFGNSLFEPLWNHHYIDNIQITATETLGVEGRGSYYEQSGILRDMLQNHLMQMLALITMEPPVDLAPESVRDEKVKALRSLRLFNGESACRHIVLGQYGRGGGMPGYRQEPEVAADSRTPTYIALEAHVDNFRWGGVPIYIRAGKRLDRRRTQIVVEFKRLPGVNSYEAFKDLPPNLLVIEVQPAEGMYFQINAKRPGNAFKMERVEMNYSQRNQYQGNVPEAYEQLILEAFHGNSSLFTRWDELEHSWRFTQSIEGTCPRQKDAFPNYLAGSRGPEAADKMIRRAGRQWWEIELPCQNGNC